MTRKAPVIAVVTAATLLGAAQANANPVQGVIDTPAGPGTVIIDEHGRLLPAGPLGAVATAADFASYDTAHHNVNCHGCKRPRR